MQTWQARCLCRRYVSRLLGEVQDRSRRRCYPSRLRVDLAAVRRGALAAQRLFRHKSSKASFQTIYWITVALNCAALGWLLSPYGVHTLETVLRAI